MKKLFVLSILVICSFNSRVFACSCMKTVSFCETSSNNNDLLMSAQIIAKFNNGIKVKIFKRIRGGEQRDTVTIWDGTPDSCMGFPWISSKVESLGDLNDTIIVSVEKIESLRNTWDSIGEYRFQKGACFTYNLIVKNDTVEGLITKSPWYGMFINNEKIQYNQFVDNFKFNINNCGVVSIKDLKNDIGIDIYPNPSKNEINIEFSNTPNADLKISLHNLLGEKVMVNQISNPNGLKIFRNNLPAGIYFLKISSGENTVTKKIVFVD